MKVDEEVRFSDIVNMGLYEVFNIFIIQLFQYIEISNIEWLI